MQYTPNYNFKAPEPGDLVNIDDISSNFAAIDSIMKNMQNETIRLAVNEVAVNSYYACPHNRSQTFTVSGNWVCPAGVTSVDVWIVGGGGGGVNYVNGNAGGGGGYSKLFKNIAVTPGINNSVIVGAGGNGAYSTTLPSTHGYSTTATANNGGYSRFRTSDIQAGGGIGGSVKATNYNSSYQYGSVSGAGGSGGGGIIGGKTLAPGKNGSNSQTLSVSGGSGLDSSIGGEGQGSPTINPYSGVCYSDGGSTATAIANSGNGGRYNGATAAENAGSSGIVIIYWTEEE